MSEYVPYQHIARPQGCRHPTCFANVELWMDELPDAIVLGGIRWVPEVDDEKPDEPDVHAD